MNKDKIVTHKFNLEISVNREEISIKYPNYKFAFSNIDEFINFIINNMTHSGEVNLSNEAMEIFGYSVKIKRIK